MPTTKTLITFIVLLFTFLMGQMVMADPIPNPPSADSIPSILEKIRSQNDLPALAVVVVTNGQIAARAAVGVRKWGTAIAVTTNDMFHIGSCTKSMTATLAARFIEEGKLRWNTTIADIFPDFKGHIDPHYETVTIEQLLTQRSGLSGQPPAAAWAQAWKENGTPVQQRLEFIRAALAQPPAAPPGTKFIYSNQNFAIVGAMLEKISGTPWEQLITEKLFRPWHMDTAGFGSPGTPGQIDQPWGHTREFGKIVPLQSDNPPAISPAGRVHCSLDDLARFAIHQMEGEQTGGLLKPETFRKLHTAPPGGNYACGWVCVPANAHHGRVIWHNGSNTMWYVKMWLIPDQNFAVIVGTNIAGPGAEKAADQTIVALSGESD